MEYGLSNHLHKPALLVFLETQEWGLIVIFYIIPLTSNNLWWWLILPIGPLITIPFFRRQERGHIEHVQVTVGLKEISGYPPFTATEFEE